jgi:alkylation response protein AidB-like acyl-CoA dehydrogenase
MHLLPSPEQEEIRASAAAFLAANAPMSRTRTLIDAPTNIDPKVWSGAADLGWFSLGLPESEGGVGCGLADEAVLFREIGRSLVSGPFLSTVLAARVASFAGDEGLTAAIIGGAPVGLVVTGEPTQLIDAVGAEHVLVVGAEQAALFAVADLGPAAPIVSIDPAVRLSRRSLDGAIPVASVTAEVDPVGRRATVLVAALQTGIAEAVRDIAAEHAKSRVQFDKPIGVHQGVKHPCADMAVEAELAWAQTLFAALANDEGRADADLQALAARVVAGHAANHGASATIQVLGGMGFTFEHDANLFLKRAYVLDHVLGDERDALDRLIALPAAV